jgi:hypothetical protein
MPTRPHLPLAPGAASGALSAAASFIPLGRAPAPTMFGRCLGLGIVNGCNGIDFAYYLFPGLIFGAAFAGMLKRHRKATGGQVAAFVLASGAANATAVFVCLALVDPLQDTLITSDLGIAICGAIAGAIGGGLLAVATRRLFPGASLARPVAAGAMLGLAVLAMTSLEAPGVFLFYIVWQAGYAAALASSLPAGA